MLHIAIVEDEKEFAEQIIGYLEKYEQDNGAEIRMSVFTDGAQILDNYQPIYDIILLDIEMPQVNGMEAAERIREQDGDVVLMFITSMAKYAIRGYAVGALDFVMKPINYFTFSAKLTRAIKRADKRERVQILLNLPDKVKPLNLEQIYYVEVQSRMLHYHTDEGEYVVRGTMQSVEKQFESHHFTKCNHWYMVNLRYVSEVRGNVAVVAGNELEISRRNKTAFLSALTGYVGRNLG